MNKNLFKIFLILSVITLLFIITCKKKEKVIENNPPFTPAAPIGSDSIYNGYVGSVYDFTISAGDPDEDSVCYICDWNDGLTDTSCFCPTGDTFTFSHIWDSGGIYLIKAKAKDTKGAVSDWSDGYQFIVFDTASAPPNKPLIPGGPDTGNVNLIYDFFCITFEPNGDSVSYQFDWGDEDTSDWSDFLPFNTMGTMSKFWSDTGKYYIRVRAKDINGEVSAWSDEHEIVIKGYRTLKWRFPTDGYVESSPALGDDGTIYFGSNDGFFYALYPTGILKWRYEVGCSIWSSPAIGTDGTIYFGALDSCFYALNPDGSLKWFYRTNGQILHSSPALGSDGTIYFGCWDDSCFYALYTDGSLKWRYKTGNKLYFCTPAIDYDGTIYFDASDHNLYALNPDGTLKWRYQITDGGCGLPIIDPVRQRIYFNAGGYFTALNRNGEFEWSYRTEGGRSPTIDSNGNVYIGGSHICVLSSTGDFIWKYITIGTAHNGSVISSDGTLYFVWFYKFYSFSLDGSLQWRLPIEITSSSPTIDSDGVVYFGTQGGLYAIYGSGSLADTPWPKFHHDLKNTGRVNGP